MLTVGARAAGEGVVGGKQKTRDVASCGELDDLVLGGFGGAICCGRSTDPSCHSYDPALSLSLSIPFSDEPPRPLSSPAACSISFAELVKGSLNPTYNLHNNIENTTVSLYLLGVLKWLLLKRQNRRGMVVGWGCVGGPAGKCLRLQ